MKRVLALALALMSAVPAGAAITPYRSMRQDGAVIQQDWSTCGAAAAATVLQAFGFRVTERQVLAVTGEPTEKGLTLLQLRDALMRLGAPASRGYRFHDLKTLSDYHRRVGIPIILHFEKPLKHFEVLVGTLGEDHLLLADPSWGLRTLSTINVNERWSGMTLISLPPNDNALESARKWADRLLDSARERAVFAKGALHMLR